LGTEHLSKHEDAKVKIAKKSFHERPQTSSKKSTKFIISENVEEKQKHAVNGVVV
jgi:hypothetical protein